MNGGNHMNDKEAMQALIDGKKVKQTPWRNNYFIEFDLDGDLINDQGKYAQLGFGSDWALYEEPPQLYTFLEAFKLAKDNQIISNTSQMGSSYRKYFCGPIDGFSSLAFHMEPLESLQERKWQIVD